MSLTLKLRPLDAAALAPYARLIRASEGKAGVVPEVMAHDGDVAGVHAFTVLCPQPVCGDVVITTLERHPHSTQSFVPLQAGRWLILVAPTLANGGPDMAAAQAFMAGPHDAICIGQNVWHAGLTVFDQPAQFGMIMWKADSGEDGVLHTLSEPIRLEF